jgi:hypothetical protein
LPFWRENCSAERAGLLQDTAILAADTYNKIETSVTNAVSGKLSVGLDNIRFSAYLPPEILKLRSGVGRRAHPAGCPGIGSG